MTKSPEKFRWVKKGHIFCPDGNYEWMNSYAQVPIVLPLSDRLRVYFSTRSKKESDGNFQSSTTFIDLNIDNPAEIIALHNRPVIGPGEAGAFDQFGSMACSVFPIGDEIRLYYGGWSRCSGVPYHQAIGLAISKDGGTNFLRYAPGPLITRSANEPFIQNCPVAMKIGDLFHMWYGTGVKWVKHGERMEPIYRLVHATSNDGINWIRDGVPILSTKREDECQTVPTVIEHNGLYHMWFSYRCGLDFRNADRGYRIGYAWSQDLLTWHRDDEIGELLPSENGWDSQMVCYSNVVKVSGRLIKFYCGNYFGQAGFGYAVCEK